MGEAAWGIIFILGIGAMVTTLLVTLAIQYFRIMCLRMELETRTPRDQAGVVTALSE